MFQHLTLQHLLGTWPPERNPDPCAWCFGSLYLTEDEWRSPEWGLQWPACLAGTGPYAYVSRKYQEAWSFLLHFFHSFIGYRIMTWGSSIKENLQATYRVEPMLVVPGCCTCCPVAPACATQHCITCRVLVTAESFEHAYSPSCGIAALTAWQSPMLSPQRPNCLKREVGACVWSNFKIQCRNFLLSCCRIPLGV